MTRGSFIGALAAWATTGDKCFGLSQTHLEIESVSIDTAASQIRFLVQNLGTRAVTAAQFEIRLQAEDGRTRVGEFHIDALLEPTVREGSEEAPVWISTEQMLPLGTPLDTADGGPFPVGATVEPRVCVYSDPPSFAGSSAIADRIMQSRRVASDDIRRLIEVENGVLPPFRIPEDIQPGPYTEDRKRLLLGCRAAMLRRPAAANLIRLWTARAEQLDKGSQLRAAL